MFNPLQDIDRRIEDLERLKKSYQIPPTQPINIFNNPNALQNDFKAQYLNENDKVEDLLVQCKTCFIDLKNRQITIKEINGDITTYGLILPKDEKDLKIEELERRLSEYEQSNNANNEVKKSCEYANGYDEPTTKRTSKSISK